MKIKIENPINGFQVAKLANDENAKNYVAMEVDGELKDLSSTINKDSEVNFVDKFSTQGLEIIRHSTAHLMAYAVEQLYGNVPLAIGPAIENGFYYDFDKSFSEADLPLIEKKMEEIIKRDEKFVREEISRTEALKIFKDQPYKLELINALHSDEKIIIYNLGDFIDLCKGPHVPSTKYLKYFKLTKVAGAYWKGDSKNKMLQRIYGTAWASKEDLDKYFNFLEEAEKRDHKKIMKIMDLAHFEYEYAPGAPFYHPKGWYIFRKFVEFLRDAKGDAGYVEIATPRLMNRCLWETSGHWEKYGEHNYSGKTEDDVQFCVKPMNCPGGILIYNQGIKSYKDLPIRMAEFGQVNRYESSGALNGLLRVREFTQDDAHVFCTFEQAEDEIARGVQLYMDVYKTMGFGIDNMVIGLSTRPEKRIGNDEIWDMAEKTLAETLDKMDIPFKIQPGEGAFYGPKLEFGFKDALNRSWQIGTIQLDMNLPSRFKMTYIDEKGEKKQPVMLHMALFGSIERFLGMYIEHVEGKFPLWFNPLQMVVVNISNDEKEYVDEVYKKLKANKFQVEKDTSNETLNYKIRDYSLKKVPYIIILGKKERENGEVAIRTLGSEKQRTMKLEDFIAKVREKIENKNLDFEL